MGFYFNTQSKLGPAAAGSAGPVPTPLNIPYSTKHLRAKTFVVRSPYVHLWKTFAVSSETSSSECLHQKICGQHEIREHFVPLMGLYHTVANKL